MTAHSDSLSAHLIRLRTAFEDVTVEVRRCCSTGDLFQSDSRCSVVSATVSLHECSLVTRSRPRVL